MTNLELYVLLLIVLILFLIAIDNCGEVDGDKMNNDIRDNHKRDNTEDDEEFMFEEVVLNEQYLTSCTQEELIQFMENMEIVYYPDMTKADMVQTILTHLEETRYF